MRRAARTARMLREQLITTPRALLVTFLVSASVVAAHSGLFSEFQNHEQWLDFAGVMAVTV